MRASMQGICRVFRSGTDHYSTLPQKKPQANPCQQCHTADLRNRCSNACRLGGAACFRLSCDLCTKTDDQLRTLPCFLLFETRVSRAARCDGLTALLYIGLVLIVFVLIVFVYQVHKKRFVVLTDCCHVYGAIVDQFDALSKCGGLYLSREVINVCELNRLRTYLH